MRFRPERMWIVTPIPLRTGVRVDRDRGEPRGPSPPTPSCVRVRTRRFEEFALTRLVQGGQTERFELGRIGEPGREGSTADVVPRTAAAAGRVPGGPWRDSVGD